MSKKQVTKSAKVPKFAEKLKAMRLARNWSLRDCEKRSGKALSRQTFLRAEQGEVELGKLLIILNLVAPSKAESAAVVELYNSDQLAKAKAEARAA